ncbi:sensor histidine kinase [Nonomuraea sp. AD125B]|uniref:sensor histidine kinase n=1 Tax=Nonomuraea sp. AD125B TaxID=3242897 RepID=UPI00352860C6
MTGRWRPRGPRTLRLRLTLGYGAIFLVAGLALLGVTYVLFDQQLTRSFEDRFVAAPGLHKQFFIVNGDVQLTGDAAVEWLRRQELELRGAAGTSLLAQGVLALAERGLHERIALEGRPADEVKRLADTFDTMVERLDHSFDGQRKFVANASHELRTPLTLNRALVELAMHRRTASPDVKELGESLLEINARHERLISGLLLLARSEQEIADRSPVDLADVVTHVVRQTAGDAAAAKVTVYEVAGQAPVTGDALLLERLVHNLVENGIRYNLDDGSGWVRVVSRTVADGKTQIEVSNTGPEVPPYEVPPLFKPFHRHGAERVVTARSAGLGLSIVRSIAVAHGGDVSARPREDGGLVVTATLPRARH